MLWRQRMKLEFEMQGLFIRTTTLVQEWQRLHGSKEAVGNEDPLLRATSCLLDL